MNWFDKNPYGPQDLGTFGGIVREAKFDMHQWGRSAFANSFAKQGFASVVLAPTAKETWKAAWRKTHRQGSEKHIQNLRQMLSNTSPGSPQHENIKRVLQKAETSGSKMGILKRVGGAGMMAGFALLPAFTTPGGVSEKGRAVAGGLAGIVGWEIGTKAGMGTGAIIGGAIGSIIPGFGTAIGAAIGGAVGYVAGGLGGAIAFDEGTQALMRIPDNMVERERQRRNLNWRGDQTAFMTQSAHTMRQQSLQAMNRGMMTSRSLLGREGVFLHQ